jgi:hypothetical protein
MATCQAHRCGRRTGGAALGQLGRLCSGGATDFAIYEGPLGVRSSHEPLACSTGGATGGPDVGAAGATISSPCPQWTPRGCTEEQRRVDAHRAPEFCAWLTNCPDHGFGTNQKRVGV